jgi:UDP-glucose 4-epimerase
MILVTGGLGYVGSHTVVELLNANYEVVCIDNLYNSSIETISKIEEITHKKFKFHNIDVNDFRLLNECLNSYKNIKAVIHFAAFKSVPESISNPIKYYENNIGTLLNILKIASLRGFNIVFSSSCIVYGGGNSSPLKEEDKASMPLCAYGASKKYCEEILLDYTNSSNSKVASLRYFNPAGAHSSNLIGEDPLFNTETLIPALVRSALDDSLFLTVHGGDYPTIDGTCIRDFIHVSDVALAHLSALKYLLHDKSDKFSVFNIGRGEGTTILQLIDLFQEISGKRPKYVIGPRRQGDIVESWANSSKANKFLNWKSIYSLKDILSTSFNWEKLKFKRAKT